MKYGSIINGLCSKNSSDLDLTLIINDFAISHDTALICVKMALAKHESEKNRYRFQNNMPRADKSGWILRFTDQKYQIQIDIMVNKTSEIYNSMLVLEYALLDQRFHKLAIVLK